MDIRLLRHAGGDNALREALVAQREHWLKFLIGGEGVAVHRAQGRVQMLDELLRALDEARKS
jgi:hypothetical protein